MPYVQSQRPKKYTLYRKTQMSREHRQSTSAASWWDCLATIAERKIVWRQLRKETKSYDFAMQKCQQAMCLAMVPTLKALQTLTEKNPNMLTLKNMLAIQRIIAQLSFSPMNLEWTELKKIYCQDTNNFAIPNRPQHSCLGTNFKKELTNWKNQKHHWQQLLFKGNLFYRKGEGVIQPRQDCYLASVDLSDAYYSIRLKEEDRKSFRFFFAGVK